MSLSANNIATSVNDNEPGNQRLTIKALREARGYSIEDLAVTCGLAHNEISDLEEGRNGEAAKLKRIAAALRVPVTDLREWMDSESVNL